MARARCVIGLTHDEYDDACDEIDNVSDQPATDTPPMEDFTPAYPSVSRVKIGVSPYLDTFYRHHPARLTIDSGATGNMIRASTAVGLGATIQESKHYAHQADGVTDHPSVWTLPTCNIFSLICIAIVHPGPMRV